MKARGLVAIVLAVVAGASGGASGQTLTTLCELPGGLSIGGAGALVQGSDGNFYGTTGGGGTNHLGTVFQVTPQGALTTLWQFSGSDGGSPGFPIAGLVQGCDGNFYGTTSSGGPKGKGTAFRISSAGTFTTLYEFGGASTDGAGNPEGTLVQGGDGYFYGTLTQGGTNGEGSVFRMSPAGDMTTLYQFGNGFWPYPDGIGPRAGLVQGSDGNFYGTTSGGGTSANCLGGCGTVFKITPQGALTTLWQFSGSDGGNPFAGLVQGSDGNFYGTTLYGGTSTNCGSWGCGTVFQITPAGNLTTLYSFSGRADDANPYAELIQGGDGNFYGMTFSIGTVFRISSDGNFTTLCQVGNNPTGGLVQGIDGNFYGFTASIVFQMMVPLNPPANQISAVQVNGNDVYLSIPSVAGETYQLQYATDLTSGVWANVPDVSVAKSIGGLLTLTNFGGAVGPQGFYRFAITP